MRLFIKENKEVLYLETYEIQKALELSEILFEFLAFDFNKHIDAIEHYKRQSDLQIKEAIQCFYSELAAVSDAFFILVWPYILFEQKSNPIINTKEAHKYREFSIYFDEMHGIIEMDEANNEQLCLLADEYFDTLIKFNSVQRMLIELCEFCLDIDCRHEKLKALPIINRLYIYQKHTDSLSIGNSSWQKIAPDYVIIKKENILREKIALMMRTSFSACLTWVWN